MTTQPVSTGTAAARESARSANGEFGTQVRAEVHLDLTEPAPDQVTQTTADPAASPVDADLVDLDRESLLALPEFTGVPVEWTDQLSDDRLRAGITSSRAVRAAHVAKMLTQSERDEAERARRASYRRPEWLRLENVGGQRQYRTAEGYYGREVVTAADGKATTSYLITSPDKERTGEADRVETMTQWIEADRAERAKTWEAEFPLDSAAASVPELRACPVDNWLLDKEGGFVFVSAEGGYVRAQAAEKRPDNPHIATPLRMTITGARPDGTPLATEEFVLDDHTQAYPVRRRAQALLLSGAKGGQSGLV